MIGDPKCYRNQHVYFIFQDKLYDGKIYIIDKNGIFGDSSQVYYDIMTDIFLDYKDCLVKHIKEKNVIVMNYIEIKDLHSANKIITAKRNSDNNWEPCIVKIQKYDKITFEEIDSKNIYDILSLYHTIKGYDINNNTLYELGVFDDLDSCKRWCHFTNKIDNL